MWFGFTVERTGRLLLSDWHTDVEWLHALPKTQYSNGLLGLHEQLTMFPAPGIDASERGLSRDEQLW